MLMHRYGGRVSILGLGNPFKLRWVHFFDIDLPFHSADEEFESLTSLSSQYLLPPTLRSLPSLASFLLLIQPPNQIPPNIAPTAAITPFTIKNPLILPSNVSTLFSVSRSWAILPA